MSSQVNVVNDYIGKALKNVHIDDSENNDTDRDTTDVTDLENDEDIKNDTDVDTATDINIEIESCDTTVIDKAKNHQLEYVGE